MSYARGGTDSAVYVFAHYLGFVQCCGCNLGDEWDFSNREDLIAHLQKHRDAGQPVPDYLFDPDTYDDSDFQPEVTR